MSTERTPRYRISLDRDACEGIFACLVRDGRFREAEDGLATIEKREPADAVLAATFADDDLETARQAARACPVDAIDVTVVEGDERD